MRLATILAAAALALSVPAAAQQTPNRGQPTSEAAQMLTVSATRPVAMDNRKLRVMLRLSSTSGATVPYAVAATSYSKVKGWSVFTENSTTCEVSGGGLTNVGYDIETRMNELDPSRWTVEGNRPSIVTADFYCDTAVSPDEMITIQTRFFVRIGTRWRQADYVFENIQVGGRRTR
ncbi:MAG: hypothetical protein JNM47_03660 [Hyphomonadaceae bacterium]|nr:hypothetical protein [Hyphomonadaceae bacterium]